jgi:hypothetical protein
VLKLGAVVTESTSSDEKPSIYINKSKYKEVCMDEVHVPNEVLQMAEASETQSQADYVNSGEFLRRFIRRIELKPQGGNYGEYGESF